jgi:hypothetical protein
LTIAIIGPTAEPVVKAAVRNKNPRTLLALAKVPNPYKDQVKTSGFCMNTPIATI